MCAMALKFHSEIIMLEFLGRYFTRESAKLICWGICKGVGDGALIKKCDGDECKIEWFHFKCVKLEEIPNQPWFCENCPNI